MEVTAEAQTDKDSSAHEQGRTAQHNDLEHQFGFSWRPRHPGFEQHPHTRPMLGLAPQQPSFPGNISLSRIPVPPPLRSLRIPPRVLGKGGP